jgi:hypothetical protein
VHKKVPESKFWKICVPGESRGFAAMKFWKILHQGQLCSLLKTEKCFAELMAIRGR